VNRATLCRTDPQVSVFSLLPLIKALEDDVEPPRRSLSVTPEYPASVGLRTVFISTEVRCDFFAG
jgi:hypothetical protein